MSHADDRFPDDTPRSWSSAPGDRFGYSVSLSGDTIVAGAVGVNGSMGAAYVLQRGPSQTFDFLQRLAVPTGAYLNATAGEGTRFMEAKVPSISYSPGPGVGSVGIAVC